MTVNRFVLSLALFGSVVEPTRAAETDKLSLWDQQESVSSVTFSPNSKAIITAGGNLATGNVTFWDVERLTRTARLNGTGMARSIAVSPDGKTLVVHGTRHLGGYLTISDT